MRSLFKFAIFVGLIGTSWASEDDLLLDISPVAVFQSRSGMSNPAFGGTVGLTWGFNDLTDIGAFAHFDNAQIDGSNSTVQVYTAGMQSWFTLFPGDIRPQAGGRLGLTSRDGSIGVHLAFQARVLAEFSTKLRGFVGGVLGGDVGDDGRSFASVDFGLQFLL